MINKSVKFFQFCLLVLSVTFSTLCFAEECERYLLPQSLPQAEELEMVNQVVSDLGLQNDLVMSDNSVHLQTQSPVRWYTESDLHSSTQFALGPDYNATVAKTLAEEAFRQIQLGFKGYQLVLNSEFTQPTGRPRVRVGWVRGEPIPEAEATLAVFTISTVDNRTPDKNTLDLLRINLVFYKLLHDLVTPPKTQE